MQPHFIHPNDKRPRVDYYRYLASREWALKKQAVYERSSGVCERDRRNPGVEVHHLSYRHLGDEPLEDLIHVCQGCHDWLHGTAFIDPAEPLPEPVNEREWAELSKQPWFQRMLGAE